MNPLGFSGPKELLAIAVDAAGVRHAIYPTAARTLCSKPDDAIGDVDAGDGGPPDCLACATAAAVFDRIDRSCPACWFRAETDGVAA